MIPIHASAMGYMFNKHTHTGAFEKYTPVYELIKEEFDLHYSATTVNFDI